MKISGRVAAALLACAALITTATSAQAADLNDPRLKDIAMQIVSSAENSTLDWKSQFGYIEDIDDGRGY
ncbi:chitosanase, partial [Lentzea aerocolonigenes]